MDDCFCGGNQINSPEHIDDFEETCYEIVKFEAESWVSSDKASLELFPLRSYDSLEFLSCSEDDDDEDDEHCRMVKLNNTIKRLYDLIRNPARRDNVSCMLSLLRKFFKYNGNDGLYVAHLPHIGEILEYLCTCSKDSEELFCFLCCLLDLCRLPPLLQRPSEILCAGPNLRRHFSLLGYLLVLVPTRDAFLGVKGAIESLLRLQVSSRRNAVKPDALREAVECSRLPVTLAEELKLACAPIYPLVLEIIFAVACVSPLCSYRLLETTMENEILLRMHPRYENGFGCDPVTDEMDLLLDDEDYYKSLECSLKILWKFMTSMAIPEETRDEAIKNLKPPCKAAMWSFRAALRREVLRAGRSLKSRTMRNHMINVILANLMGRTAAPKWDLVEFGLAEDIGVLVSATEYGTKGTWAERAIFETNHPEGLDYKKNLLFIVALLAEEQPNSIEVLKNKNVVCAALQLISPDPKAAKIHWNNEQLRYLFKYASNALNYLAPKIPEEFIGCEGSARCFLKLKNFLANFDVPQISCFMEMMCGLADCDIINKDLREHEFTYVLEKMIFRFMKFEAISVNSQKIITFLLSTYELTREIESRSQRCHCGLIERISLTLLERCLQKKFEDSELKRSYLVAIGSFIWKGLSACSVVPENFINENGIYLILDMIECSDFLVKNFFLGLLTDLSYKNCCGYYLFSWRRADKKRNILSLLADIWRKEEQLFKVKRSPEGCVEDILQPTEDDYEWFYMYYTKSICVLNTAITTAIGTARQKIFKLKKIMMCDVAKNQKHCYEVLYNNLSTEDQITMLAIDAYDDIKVDEAAQTMTKILKFSKLNSLTKSRRTYLEPSEKISDWAVRVKNAQYQLLELRNFEELVEEQEELQSIKGSVLSRAFDAYRDISFVGKTGSRAFLSAKCREQRNMAEAELVAIRTVEPFLKTFNYNANVSAVFNQRSTMRCIKKQEDECAVPLKEISTCSLTSEDYKPPNASATSLASYKSDSSLLLKKIRLET